jgi:hypothetical protein
MSFISVLKTIGTDALKVLGVTTSVASSVAGIALSPAAAAILGKINSAVVGAEALIQGAQQGAAKKESVTQILLSEIPTLEQVIQQFGSGTTFDPTALSNAIDASVANYNAIAALVASAKKAVPAQSTTGVVD